MVGHLASAPQRGQQPPSLNGNPNALRHHALITSALALTIAAPEQQNLPGGAAGLHGHHRLVLGLGRRTDRRESSGIDQPDAREDSNVDV